jgi:hypothetical protein
MKCRECADKALTLAREARTVRETRNILQLAEIWLRLAARFDRCIRPPPQSSEDELSYIFLSGMPQIRLASGTARGQAADPNDKRAVQMIGGARERVSNEREAQ